MKNYIVPFIIVVMSQYFLAEVWRWPLTSIQCRDLVRVEHYLHSPIRLRAVVSTFPVSRETGIITTCFVIFIWPRAPLLLLLTFSGL
jgi:hypothetical protein